MGQVEQKRRDAYQMMNILHNLVVEPLAIEKPIEVFLKTR
jgi:hypothetical protein